MASAPDNILKNKIDFYSCVYFTIFPIHPISGKPANEPQFKLAQK